MTCTLLWFRGHDLRLGDNAALATAAARSGPVIPVYVQTPADEGDWPPGAATRWWLHHSLRALDADLRAVGSRLVIHQATHAADALLQLARETGADMICAHRRSEPAAALVEVAAALRLGQEGVELRLIETHTLVPLGQLRTGEDRPYRVFTPFWRAMQSLGEPSEPVPQAKLTNPVKWPMSVSVEALDLLPTPDWADGLRATWVPGERGARERLLSFCARVADYDDERNRPDLGGTSSLSPHLRFGELSPRQAWHAARGAAGHSAEPWLRQLAWRDFGHHLLHAFPHTATQPLRSEFTDFSWQSDGDSLRAWQQGQTGFPLVDAGMRQLWRTGWMHNRVRMVVASFLVKDLLLPWQRGTRWFWDTLVDADLASNTLGWQWTAGCGADAAPYFRVFNPVSQAERFDPDAAYIRRWVPELAARSARDAHRPWDLPLASGGYPMPMVNHSQARQRALVAYQQMRA